MLCRPRWSPRSPYTTLFRSPVAGFVHLDRFVVQPVSQEAPKPKVDELPDNKKGGIQVGQFPLQYRIDRKSTRLNSSHVAISYAVFCLKKKRNLRLGSTTRNK